MSRACDVAVIGGGAAGLNAAIVLGRARRSVIVIDAGSPRNAPAAGVHGFLTRDGISPAELIKIGQQEVASYGGTVLRGEAVAARRADDGFEVTVDDGTVITARRLLVTTGLVDELPDLPGVRERWGRDVLHCPYCHGWEVRDQPIGVIGTGSFAVHQASLFRQWTSDLVLFTHTGPELTAEQAEQFAARGVRVVPGVVSGLELADDRITGVRLADGTVVARQAVVVGPRVAAAAGFLVDLGLRPIEHPRGIGTHIPADPTGRTEVAGVWVAGNVTDPAAQVITAAAGGVAAAAAINMDLITEETEQAVARLRQAYTAEYWDERYGSADRLWSGNANPQLMATASALAPARALDVGSGEGADAIWLASRGWQVTAVDVSRVALHRAAQRAAEAGTAVADRITWQQADVLTWAPEAARYDLVSAQFMQLPRYALADLHRRLAAAVRPGGTLLIVGHHPSDLHTSVHRRHLPDLLFTAEEIAATFDPAEWDLEATTPSREVVDPEGRSITIHDAALRAVRRA